MPTTKRLSWNTAGNKKYQTGAKDGVLYPFSSSDPTKPYPLGVAWDGFRGFEESPDGGDPKTLYANDVEYANIPTREKFKGKIKAYYYPDEFDACQGAVEIAAGARIRQQNKNTFGLAYTTTIGSDTNGLEAGYVIHLVYGCLAGATSISNETIGDDPDAVEMEWDVTTTPVPVTINGTSYKPTATMDLDSTVLSTAAMTALENALYGTTTEDPYLPLPDEIYSIIYAADHPTP